MNSLPTIHGLRKSLNRVRISHFRRVVALPKSLNESVNLPTGLLESIAKVERVTKIGKRNREYSYISPKGGSTIVEFTNASGKTFTATANCSNRDAFNRLRGINICLGRLQSQGAF